jgi:hypothetical protein
MMPFIVSEGETRLSVRMHACMHACCCLHAAAMLCPFGEKKGARLTSDRK